MVIKLIGKIGEKNKYGAAAGGATSGYGSPAEPDTCPSARLRRQRWVRETPNRAGMQQGCYNYIHFRWLLLKDAIASSLVVVCPNTCHT